MNNTQLNFDSRLKEKEDQSNWAKGQIYLDFFEKVRTIDPDIELMRGWATTYIDRPYNFNINDVAFYKKGEYDQVLHESTFNSVDEEGEQDGRIKLFYKKRYPYEQSLSDVILSLDTFTWTIEESIGRYGGIYFSVLLDHGIPKLYTEEIN